MKLHLPHKFQAALMAAIASVSVTTLSTGAAYGAELNEIITMNSALVNSAPVHTAVASTAWEMADGEKVYSFSSNQYIGGISAADLTTALGDSKYITVAAWINPTSQKDDTMGSIFGYGAQGNGIMFKDVGGHLRVTTKGKNDINFDPTGIEIGSWELVAVTFHMSNSTTLEARVMLNEQAYTDTKTGGINTADPAAFSIGSGNSGASRDAFQGSIGGLKVFTSDTWAEYSDVAGLMGSVQEIQVASLVWNGTAGNAEWNTVAGNWTKDGESSAYISSTGVTATFDSGDVAKDVVVGASLLASSVTVNDAYTFQLGGNKLLISNALTVAANASLTLNGPGTVTAGSISLGSASTLNVASNVTVQNAMALSSSNPTIHVKDGGVLSISTLSTVDDQAMWNSSKQDGEITSGAFHKIFTGNAVSVEGSGRLVLSGNVNVYETGATYTANVADLEITGNFKVNSNNGGATWALGDKQMKVGGDMWLSNHQTFTVAGGTVEVGNHLKLAHESNTASSLYGVFKASDNANVTLGGIEFVGGGNAVTIENSTLTFTGGGNNVLTRTTHNATAANTVTLNNATLVATDNSWTMAAMSGNDLTTVTITGDTTVNVGDGQSVSISATTFTDGTIIKQGTGSLSFIVADGSRATLNKTIQVQGGSLLLSGTYAVDDITPDADSIIEYYNAAGEKDNSGFRKESLTKTVFTLTGDASIDAWNYASFTNNDTPVELDANGKFTLDIPTDYTTLWVNGTDTASYTTYATAAQGKGQTLTGVRIADGATLILDTTTPVSEGIITVQGGTANIQMETGSSITGDDTARNLRLSGAGTYTTTGSGLKAGVSTAAEGAWTGTIDATAVDSSWDKLFNLYTSTAVHGGTVLLKTVTGDPTDGADTVCLTMQLGGHGKSSETYTFAQTTFKTENSGNLRFSDYDHKHSWIVGGGTTLDVSGGIRMDHKQTLSIQGGTVTTGGEIVLGHAQSGTSPSGLTMTAGSLRTSGIHVIANSDTASTISITGGTVEFTSANPLQLSSNSTATVTLGGSGADYVTLQAAGISWSVAHAGMTIGNIKAETNNNGAITLGAAGKSATYTGSIEVAENSSLTLAGTVTASGATQASGISVTGALTLDANVKFDLSTFTGTGSDEEGYSYTVFSGAGATGLFDRYAFSVTNITGVDITGKDWKFNDGTISYTLSTTFIWGNEAGTSMWNYVDENWGEGNAFRENGTAQFFQNADVTVDDNVVANTIVVGDAEHEAQVNLTPDGSSTLAVTTLQVDNGTIATNMTLANLQTATVAEGSTWSINAAQAVGTAGTFNGALELGGNADLVVNGSFTLGENATIAMDEGSRLELSDAGVGKRLMTGGLLAEGRGTLVVDADITLNNNESTTANGKLVMKDHLLKMGSGETQKVSLASFSSVELDNAQIMSDSAHDTIHNLTVGASKTGTFVSIDMDNGNDATYQFDGATSVGAEGTLTIANYWNAQVNVAALVGDGTLKVMGNANETGISLQTVSKQEITFTVGSLSTEDASFTGDLVIDHRADTNQDTFTINTGSKAVSFRSLTVNYNPAHATGPLAFNLGANADIGMLTLTSGAVNVGGTGTLTVGGLAGTSALTMGENANLTVNVAESGEYAYAGTLTVSGTLSKDGAGALALNGTGNVISSSIDLKNGSLALNGTFDLSGFSHETTYSGGAETTNGFVVSFSGIQLVNVTGGTLTQGAGASFLVDNLSVTLNTDSSSAGYGRLSYNQDTYSTFYVNNGSTDYVSNAVKVPAGTPTPTISLSNGTTLVADDAAVSISTDNISLASGTSATLRINEGVTVNAGSTDKSLTLTGEGIYKLATGAPDLKGVTLDNTNWTGIVMVSGWNQTIFSYPNGICTANSYVGMNGVSGVDAKWNAGDTDWQTLNFYLEDPDDGIAWNWNNGASGGATARFAGKMAGSGTLKKTDNSHSNSFYFKGDVSDWNGTFLVAGESKDDAFIQFTGAATDIAVTVENADDNAYGLQIINGADVTMSGDVKKSGTGAMNVTVGANTTFSGSVQATDLTVNANKGAIFNGMLNVSGNIFLNAGSSLTLAGETTIAQAIAGTATSTVVFSHDITASGLEKAGDDVSYRVGANDAAATDGNYFLSGNRTESTIRVVTGSTVVPGGIKVTQGGVAYVLKDDGTAAGVTADSVDYTLFYQGQAGSTLNYSDIATTAAKHGAEMVSAIVGNQATLNVDQAVAAVMLDSGIVNINDDVVFNGYIAVIGGDGLDTQGNKVKGQIDTTKVGYAQNAASSTTFTGAPVENGGVRFTSEAGSIFGGVRVDANVATGEDLDEYSIGNTRFAVGATKVEMTGATDAVIAHSVLVDKVYNSAENATGQLTLGKGAHAYYLKEVVATSGDVEFLNMAEANGTQEGKQTSVYLDKVEIGAGKTVSFYETTAPATPEELAKEAVVTVKNTLTAGTGATLNSDLVMQAGSVLNVSEAQESYGLTMGSSVFLKTGNLLGESDLTLLGGLEYGEYYYLFNDVEDLYINGEHVDKLDFQDWQHFDLDASQVYTNLDTQTYALVYNWTPINGSNVGTIAITIIPEPTTGTLSLLALMALAARRRRH